MKLSRVAGAVVACIATTVPASQAGATVPTLRPGTSWDWQIGASTPNPSTLDNAHPASGQKMLDVDMEGTSASMIATIKAKGIVPVCYIETGAWEDYRSDAGQFPKSTLGVNMDGYPSERYLDTRNATVESLIKARIQRAANKGCKGIEPDIDDAYIENGVRTGFPIHLSDVLAYNKRLADYAHSLGLMFGLKNGAGTGQVGQSVAWTDFALNEQCNQYSECGEYNAYVSAGKAVFQVEYKLAVSNFCPKDNNRNFDGIRKHAALGSGYRVACRNG